jgi:hypothetical protein
VELDLNHGWWTPPLSPRQAHDCEAGQIAELEMDAIVSLTDHDDIEAPMSLQAIDASRHVPVSVEWTVPYRSTFFHLGIHNMPARRARDLMAAMAEFTASPQESKVPAMLEELRAGGETLTVLNHPFWDEKGVGSTIHVAALEALLTQNGPFLDALEVNGLRPWSENRQAMQLAHAWSKPAVAGGDRHAIEPNAVLNLSNAADFPEFVEEVRDGHSDILLTHNYRRSYASRILHNTLDVLQTHENHSRGWTKWQERVFFTNPDGTVSSLSAIWGEKPPGAVAAFAKLMSFAEIPRVRHALRAATWQKEPVSL